MKTTNSLLGIAMSTPLAGTQGAGKFYTIKRLYFIVVLAIAGIVPVLAQNTVSGIEGKITAQGEVLVGAAVKATNSETGAVYGTVSSSSGLYSLSGLKPGVYSVQFSFIGYETVFRNGVRISLGEEYRLDIDFNEADTQLKEVVISASRSRNFNEIKTGQTYSVQNATINMLPSVNRSLLDYARLSPYSGTNNSMAGRDGRGTTLTIDGASLNNSFGLNSSLPGAGTPVSIDAVEEAQIVIAPFDVRQSNFTGGGINVVTKSGSNTLRGTAYSYVQNQDLRGNRVAGADLGDRTPESKTVYGMTLGGPIVKNKLFYFVNAEYENKPQSITKWKLSEDGVGHADQMISRVTQADMDRFATALGKYGYDPGSSDLSNGDQTNAKILARLDWNISDRHNLMVRYNYTQNTSWNTPNGTSTVGTKATSARISDKAYAFHNNCYTIKDLVWSGVVELNSRIGDRTTNRLLVTASDVSNARDSESAWFPHVDIWDGSGNAFMSAGYELFSNGTGNHVRTYDVSDHLRWTVGNNTLTAGFSYQYQKGATNYKMYGTSYYKYASISDFENGAAPIAFGMTYPYDGVDDPASRTSFGQTALFAQNEWRIMDNLAVTYGIRADYLAYYEELGTNESFKALDWTSHYYTPGEMPSGFAAPSIDTGSWPKAKVQMSPRIGFNWDVNNDHSIVLRGGAGVFTGRTPLVFFTNVPNYSGMLQNTVMVTNDANGVLSGLANNFLYKEADLRQYLKDSGYSTVANPNPVVKNATICGVASDFKLPSVIKTSLAADVELPVSFPATLTIEGIYNKDINAVYSENLNLKSDSYFARFAGVDDRVDYKTNADGTPATTSLVNTNVTGGAVVMRNTPKGYSWSFGTTLSAQPARNLNAEISYIHMVSKSVSDMNGSALYSTWTNTASVNSANEEVARSSAYVLPDKLSANVTYTINHGKIASTNVGLFYTGRNAGVYSYTYANDMNGDGATGDLIYIPSDKSEINFVDNGSFTAAQQQDAFWEFVNSDKYLSRHKGGYAEANAARMPWFNRFDLRIAENIKVKAGKSVNTLQLSMDIMNVGNLLNSSWGVYKTASACDNGKILTYSGKNAQNQPEYKLYSNADGLLNNAFAPLKTTDNCWYLQIGLKYLFN